MSGPERVVDEVDGDPGHDRDGRERDLAEELPAGPELEVVVEDADQRSRRRRRRTAPASSVGDDRGMGGHELQPVVGDQRRRSATTRNATATAIPPPRGTGARVDPARGRAGRRLERGSPGAGQRRQHERRDQRRDPERHDEERQHLAERSIRRIGWSGVAPREPRDREAGDQLRGPRRGCRSWTAASSRRRMASTISSPDLRASPPGPKPRRRRRRRADADPGRDVGRVLVERDRVLVDGDADVVEERLGLAAGHAQRRHVDEHEVVVGAAAR